MADFSNFRPSPDIEDRQNETLPLGPFGTPGLPPNIFVGSGGTMTGFNPNTDFVPQPSSPSQLSIDAGINALPNTGSSGPSSYSPQGILSSAIINAESGGNSNAKNPNSSASGPGQFIDSTWLSTIKAARPDLAQGKSDADLLALKTDPQLGREMTDYYANQNQGILSKAGVPVTPGTTYLAHFAGPGGAVKILQADPNASAADILGPGVVKANPFLANMTAQDLQAWAAKKMGASVPTAGVQTSPQASPASPTNAIPQQPAPTFPQAPPQQQAEPQAAPQFAQIPQTQQPPIFYAPRKPINIAALQAAFRPPVFPQG